MFAKKHPVLGYDDLKFRLIGIPIVSLLVPLIFFGENFGSPIYWTSFYFSTFYTILYWHICRYFFIVGNTKFPDIADNKKRLVWILLRCFLTIIILCNLCHTIIEPFMLYNHIMPKLFKINAASLVSFFLIAGIYESMRYMSLWEKALTEKEVLQRENVVSQLEGLKNQVNPHFLFNSLNTLVNIIPENPDSAVKFVQKLSKVYRYILEIRDTETTPLSSELDFLNAYIYLLKERFGDNLQIHIASMDSHLDKQIVPLSLQILFENAIKHNIISAQRPLSIEVFMEGDNLIVKNIMQRKNQVQEGTGVGLQNIKNRYQLVSNKTVVTIVTPQSFMVSLPLM
jgi:two-component system, LytTR family, sensor kinase